MDLATLMDRCISGYGEMDIAIIVMTIYKENLPKGKDLYIKLNNEVFRLFLERSVYWEQHAVTNPSRYNHFANTLLEIALKFKETKFKKAIMDEIEYLKDT